MNESDRRLAHGPRLTLEEYQRRVVGLAARQDASPSRQAEREYRRAELDLAIDHKLGQNFPVERRAALWAVQERIERRRAWLMLRHLVRRIWQRGVERGSTGLARFAESEFRTVLSDDEVERFLGDNP